MHYLCSIIIKEKNMTDYERMKEEIYSLVGRDDNAILNEFNELNEEKPILTNRWNNLASLADKMDKQKFFESMSDGFYASNDTYITISNSGYLVSSCDMWDWIKAEDFLKHLKAKYCDYSVVVLKEYAVMETYTFKTKIDAIKKANEIIKEWERTKKVQGGLEIGKFKENEKEGAWYDNLHEWGSVTIIPTTIEE
jgi:hypothetical protein